MHLSLRATCPLAFAEALAQAGQGLARLLESYGEQAGGSAAISIAPTEIASGRSPLAMTIGKKVPHNDRAKVKGFAF